MTLLYEPLRPVPSVAIFGMGHVGPELARILARHDVELHLVDSRAGQVEPDRLGADHRGRPGPGAPAPRAVPELVLGELPAGSHVLIMTHDHAEDAALCDAALRCGHLGVDRADRVVGEVAAVREEAGRRGARTGRRWPGSRRRSACPEITGKDPATIAVGVAADLVLRFERAATDNRAEQAVS